MKSRITPSSCQVMSPPPQSHVILRRMMMGKMCVIGSFNIETLSKQNSTPLPKGLFFLYDESWHILQRSAIISGGHHAGSHAVHRHFQS